MTLQRVLASTTAGLLGAAGALFLAGATYGPGFAEVLLFPAGLLAVPAALMTIYVLAERNHQLRVHPTRRRLLLGITGVAIEMLTLMTGPALLIGLFAAAMNLRIGLHGVVCGMGLALGCLIGAGRPVRKPRALIDRAGPPFFDTRGDA